MMGLGNALLLRVALSGAGGAGAIPAALLFSLALVVLSLVGGWRPHFTGWRQAAMGVTGAAVLVLPPALHALSGSSFEAAPWQGFPAWALPVAVVGASEEIFFRGVLYEHVRNAADDLGAIVVGALLFAVTHVALNGGHALVLDGCVGVWLGVLRMTSGGVAAPATAHVLADLAAWWLR